MEETALLPPPPTLDAFLERLNLLQTSVASQFQQQIEIVEKVLRAKKGHTGENSAAADEEVPLWCVRHEDVTVVESVEEMIREFSKKVRGKLGEVVSRHVEMDVGLLHEMGVYEMIRPFRPISAETTQKALCTFLDGTTNGDDLRLCLKVGADVNGLFDGHTALIRCVVADNREAAEMLVRDGVDLEGKIGRDVHGGVVVGDTAVISAARLHRWGMLEWLIAEGANANAVTADGKKALEVACEAAEVQLSEGEESLFDSTVLPQENHPALRSAMQGALKALLEKTADVADFQSLSLVHFFCLHEFEDLLLLSLSKGVDINAANPLDLTALDYAVQKRRVEFVKILVDNGATATGSIFLRAIPQARVQRDDFVSNVQRILEILLDGGVGVNSRVGTHSALHRAVQLGVIEIVRFLVQRGADLESRDELDRTPYQLARQIARYARSWQYHPVDRRIFPEMVDLLMPARPPSDQD